MNSKPSKLRTMTNYLCIAIAILLISHVTCTTWKQMGVTCELEDETIQICGGLGKVPVKRCRGTCQSISKILSAFPWYETICECCKSTRFTQEDISCPGGRVQKIFHAKSCSCQRCYGA
ncbi:hypothetical protein OS493_033050 [Desmophyllum pertusum]|uniref:Uncharacterized protein n=1 Tax=Desmophyllum pertusum TaxID=174260 RepID=A0A9W9ZMH3_9CNID|nr:hypothetical protein OS493_033050 [Desmophyllum pertusum]